MKLIFEKSAPGRKCSILPKCDVETVELPKELQRELKPALPEMSETDISRHYTELNHRVHGVNCGFYPLGSCTMKYNPRIDEEMAALPGFTAIHPLAPRHTTEGCREVLDTIRKYLCEVTGMADMTFQPSAGAHGEFTGVLLIKQYHDSRGGYQAQQDNRARFRPRHQSRHSGDVRLSGGKYRLRPKRLRGSRGAEGGAWRRYCRPYAD